MGGSMFRKASQSLLPLLVILCTCPPCHGHSEGPSGVPLPPPVPLGSKTIQVNPAPWSWLHWWEANRDPYLETIRQGRSGQKPDQEVIAAFRVKAVEALLEATKSEHWRVRAWAAMALGRMAEANANIVLWRLAQEDDNETVRACALIASGLLDTDDSQAFLRRHRYATPLQQEAGLVAIGLLSQPEPNVVVSLQGTLGGSQAGPATLSAWALKYQTDPGTKKVLQKVLERTRSSWLASEAILALGRTGDVKSVMPLADILLETDRGKSLPAWQDLDRGHKELCQLANRLEQKKTTYDRAYEQYAEQYRQWQQNNPNATGPQAKQEPGAGRHIVVGVERIYQCRLRGSAAIALGQIDHPHSCQALCRVLAQRNDGYSNLYKSFAIMSLGQLGNPQGLSTLESILRSPRRKSSSDPASALPGYAALAMGLYARPVQTPQGPQDRPHYAKVCQLLAGRMADVKEDMEVRTAAALALGLTGRTENLKLLQAASKTIGAREEILTGYTLLARGMLGDKTIVERAKKFLAVTEDRTNASGILARRAAVLALGVLGSQEGIPILVDAWDLSYYVNREVALAFWFCQAHNVTDPLVKLLKESENPWEQSFAARCLGELFTAVRPQRMGRLLNDSNYTMKNTRMVPFQTLTNEFLFNYLIASFGDEWR